KTAYEIFTSLEFRRVLFRSTGSGVPRSISGSAPAVRVVHTAAGCRQSSRARAAKGSRNRAPSSRARWGLVIASLLQRRGLAPAEIGRASCRGRVGTAGGAGG